MNKHTITLKELEARYTGTYSVKADTPRGRKEVSFYNLKVGDEVIIDNYFTEIVEETQEGETMETIRDEIMELLNDMSQSGAMRIWNEYIYAINRYDDEIFDSYTLEEMIENSSEGSLFWVNRFFYGSDSWTPNGGANPNREYFTLNGYGNILSSDWATEWIEFDEVANYIIENNDSLYDDDIQNILDRYEKEIA